jgi:hypothetical protein
MHTGPPPVASKDQCRSRWFAQKFTQQALASSSPPLQQLATMAPAAVPESLLKKRQRDEKWALEKTQKAAVAKKEAKEKRKVIFKKAEAYVKEYRAQVRLQSPVALTFLDSKTTDQMVSLGCAYNLSN